MYQQTTENWWGRMYNYVKHAIEAGGYDAAKSIEKLAKSYFTENKSREYANDGSQTYSKVCIKKYYTGTAQPANQKPYTEEEVVKNVEVIKTELNAVKELVLREAITIDNSVSQINSGRTDVQPPAVTSVDVASNDSVDDVHETAGMVEDFEKTVRKGTISLSDHQLTFLMEKIKKNEADVAKTKRVLLIATSIFSITLGLLFFVLK